MSAHPSPPSRGSANRSPLPIQATVKEAYRLLWGSRDDLLRLGVAPVLVSFVLEWLAHRLSPGLIVLLLALATMLPLTLFAVNWHRLVLLGPAQAAAGLGVRWERRETRFLYRTLLLALGVAVVMVVPTLLAMGLLQRSPLGYPIMGAIAFVGLLLSLRFSLVYPATAVDERYGFAQSWSDTSGCGFQLLAGVVLASVPIWLAFYALRLIAMGTGLAAAAPLSLLLLDHAGDYVAAAAYLTVLSLVFRRQTGWPTMQGST